MSRRMGKFEDDLDELVHVFGMEPDEEAGSVTETGNWIGLVLNITEQDMRRVAKDTDTAWRDVQSDINRGQVAFPIHAVITENSDGFVGVYYYGSVSAARQAFYSMGGTNELPEQDEPRDNPRRPVHDLRMHSWFGADTFLKGSTRKTLAHNTTVIRFDDGIGVKYHGTVIVFYHNDRVTITVNTGGWNTVTTRQRINELLPSPWGVRNERKLERDRSGSDLWLTYGGEAVDEFRGNKMTFRTDRQVMGHPSSGYDYTKNPHDLPGERYEVLEPNWHNMGRWALAGLGHYINPKGKIRKKLNPSDRHSVIALLATACAASFYVHDIATELMILLGRPESMGLHSAHSVGADARAWLNTGSAGAWDELRKSLGGSALHKRWGEASNDLSDAVSDN